MATLIGDETSICERRLPTTGIGCNASMHYVRGHSRQTRFL